MILKVRNASFGYRPPEMILRDITFEAHPGELIAVLGPNGAGKTTLLRCILGSLKWTGGESTIDGLDIRRSDSRKLRQKLAYHRIRRKQTHIAADPDSRGCKGF